MLVYHGSYMEIEIPKIITAEKGRDFGFGFYTTSIKEQATRWAKRKALIEQRKNKAAVPVVNIYEFDEEQAKQLKVKRFAGSSKDWLNFVIKCRSDVEYEHQYDIVIGNIADDNVGETVSFVMSGIMRKEDALERLKFQKINDQIAFSTQEALCCLSFKGTEVILSKEGK